MLRTCGSPSEETFRDIPPVSVPDPVKINPLGLAGERRKVYCRWNCLREHRICIPGKERNNHLLRISYTFLHQKKEQDKYNGFQHSEDIKKGIFKSFFIQPSCSN